MMDEHVMQQRKHYKFNLGQPFLSQLLIGTQGWSKLLIQSENEETCMWSCPTTILLKTGELFNFFELNFPKSNWLPRSHVALKLYDFIVIYFFDMERYSHVFIRVFSCRKQNFRGEQGSKWCYKARINAWPKYGTVLQETALPPMPASPHLLCETPNRGLSTSATRRSAVPNHRHQLTLLPCLPDLPSELSGNSVTCGTQAVRESWKCLAF